MFFPASSHDSANEVYDAVHRSIAVVYLPEDPEDVHPDRSRLRFSGSGVVVGRTEVVTNCHVIAGTISDTYIVEFQGRTFLAYRDFGNEDRDLCLLYVPGIANAPRVRPVQLGSVNDLSVGDEVYVAANPGEPYLAFSSGNVSLFRKRIFVDDTIVSAWGRSRIIQFDAKTWYGSSGGGLFNTDGELVGIASSLNLKVPGVAYAYPVEWVTDLILEMEESARHGRVAVRGYY